MVSGLAPLGRHGIYRPGSGAPRGVGGGAGGAAETRRSTQADEARQAAEQFAALFVQQILKAARSSTGQSGFFPGGLAGQVYGDMFLQTMAEKVAAGGLGLTEWLAREFGALTDRR